MSKNIKYYVWYSVQEDQFIVVEGFLEFYKLKGYCLLVGVL